VLGSFPGTSVLGHVDVSKSVRKSVFSKVESKSGGKDKEPEEPWSGTHWAESTVVVGSYKVQKHLIAK
jgi:hypothetical protein